MDAFALHFLDTFNHKQCFTQTKQELFIDGRCILYTYKYSNQLTKLQFMLGMFNVLLIEQV